MQDIVKYPGFWLKLLVVFSWLNLLAMVLWLMPHFPIPVKYLGQYIGLLLQVAVALIVFIRVNELQRHSYKNYTVSDWIPAAMIILGLTLLWLSLAMYAKSAKNAELEVAVGVIGILMAIFGTTRVKTQG